MNFYYFADVSSISAFYPENSLYNMLISAEKIYNF